MPKSTNRGGGSGRASKPNRGATGGVVKPNKPNKPNKPKPSRTVVDRANRNRNNRMFGQMGGYEGVNQSMVERLINQTVRPQMEAMRNDRDYIDRNAQYAIDDANSQFGNTLSGLNKIFDTTGTYVAGLGTTINSNYDNTGQQIASRDAAVGSQIDSNTSAEMQAINAQLAAAGLGGMATPDASINADAAFAKDMAAQQAANNQTNNEFSQQSANTLTGLLGGMIQGSRASNLGAATQSHQGNLNEIGRARREDLSSINDAMQELRASKPGMIREMLLQLQAQGFDQWQALQALNMQRKQMRHGFAMDSAQMNQQAAYYGTSAQAWGSQANSGSGSGSSGSSWGGGGSTQLAGPASNPSWTPNPPRGGKPGKGRGKGGRKGGRPYTSGSQADAIYGPLAGGAS